MTVVVALKAGDYLQPRGRHLAFEQGIVMAGDSRISYIGGSLPPEDDHAKVDSINDFAIAGYAGNRSLATSVLSRLEEAVLKQGDFSPDSVALLAQRMLVAADLSASALPLVHRRVQMLLGIRDCKTQKFVLYEMRTDNGFTPKPRDGMVAIGSHGHYVKSIFEQVRDVATKLPGDPFKGPRVTLKDNLAPFVCLLLDKALETASEVEGQKSLIGGQTHLVVLHSRGVEAMNPDENTRLRI